jgi:hypothetical protein
VPGGPQLLGSVPVKAIGPYAPLPATPLWGSWAPIADCCIGCVNMAYSLQGESCPIIWDNGAVDLGPTKGGSPSMDVANGVQSRTADDFVPRPCIDQQVCYIEIYRNECGYAITTSGNPADNRPAGNLPASTPFITLTPSMVIPTNQTALINGVLMNGYQLQFFPPPNVILPAGQTLWLSAGGKNLGNIGGRAYFAYAADCRRNCPIRFEPGVTRTLVTGQTAGSIGWQFTNPPRDFAFRVAVKYAPNLFGATPGPVTITHCQADVNNDGFISTQDIFDYLNAWFAGCP